MELDTNKIDDAVLALLYLGLHDGARAWKALDRKRCQDRVRRAFSVARTAVNVN
jgi:hypothetical protein